MDNRNNPKKFAHINDKVYLEPDRIGTGLNAYRTHDPDTDTEMVQVRLMVYGRGQHDENDQRTVETSTLLTPLQALHFARELMMKVETCLEIEQRKSG